MKFLSKFWKSKKKQKTKTILEISDMRKVCVVLGMDGDYGIFLVDLDKAQPGDGFVEIEPNLRVRSGAEPLLFRVIDARLLIFYMSDDPQVYSIKLSTVCTLKEVIIKDKSNDKLEKLHGCSSSKRLPQALSLHGDRVLLFSTRIKFASPRDTKNDGVIDFEVYDCSKNVSVSLPQLHICRASESPFESVPLFRILNHATVENRGEKFSGSNHSQGADMFRADFFIVSFGVDGNRFIIQTDFGRMFSLDLQSPDEGWGLCDEGYKFFSYNENIMTRTGLCFDAYGGVNDYRLRWMKMHGGDKREMAYKQAKVVATTHSQDVDVDKDEIVVVDDDATTTSTTTIRSGYSHGICVRLPITAIGDIGLQHVGGHCSSSINLLGYIQPKHYVVQIALDPDTILMGRQGSSRLYWVLDVFNINLKLFAADDCEKKENKNFVKQSTTFKFRVKDEHVFLADVAGFFPC